MVFIRYHPVFAFTFIASILSAVGVFADQTICDETQISVSSVEPELATQICSVTRRAIKAFEACGLAMDAPLTITIVPVIEAKDLNCIGIFDCGTNTIEVLHPDAIMLGSKVSNAFDQLPIASLFESVIVHELAHAFLQASSVFEQVPHTEAEYVAYAMQLEALSKADRQIILDKHKTSDVGSASGINEVVLAMSPPAFAAISWNHFSQPENGCRAIGRIIDGEVLFPMVEL